MLQIIEKITIIGAKVDISKTYQIFLSPGLVGNYHSGSNVV
jgi:hypothetical protein